MLSSLQPKDKLMNYDFDFMREEGFEQTFMQIEEAMDDYYDAPKKCCASFRKALEAAIVDIYHILEVTIPSNYKVSYRAKHIKQIIPDEFYDDKLFLEIDNVRRITNNYNHLNWNETQEPNKDKKTCYIGMYYICQWIVNFSKEYPSYLLEREKQEEEERKKQEEKDKKDVLSVIISIISIISIIGIFALLFGTKKSE